MLLFMLLESERDQPVRVLGVFPHPRHVGHVVLDENGLVQRGWFVCRTRRYPTLDGRLDSLDRLILRSIARYRPTVIVLVRARGCPWLDAMTGHAITTADRTGLPLRIRYESALTDLFVDADASEYDRLGQSITRVFFPELARGVASWRRGGDDLRRRPRSVWKAAAGALAALAEARPDSVRALAREPLPAGLALLIDRLSRPLL